MHTSFETQQGIPDGALVIPASFAQHRMWFLERLLPVNGVYNVFNAYHLHGYLNVASLERSINAVIERHEGLRTRFMDREGVPWQVILRSLDNYGTIVGMLGALFSGGVLLPIDSNLPDRRKRRWRRSSRCFADEAVE